MVENIFSDTISYAQFKIAMVALETNGSYSISEDHVFIPACVLGLTAIANTLLITNWDGKNKQVLVSQTTIVFIAGGLLSILTYFICP